MENVDQNEMVQRLLTLMSQREKLDKEIDELRAVINSSIAQNRNETLYSPPTFEPQGVENKLEVFTSNENVEDVPPPPFIETLVQDNPQTIEEQPLPKEEPAPIPVSKPLDPIDRERNLGVKWMAIVGIFIENFIA